MADIIVDGTIGAKRFLLLDSTGKIPAVDGSQVTALAAGNIATDIIPIARIDVGTTANKLVQLDANAKLPALDASLLTNIPGATKSSSDPAIDTNPSGGVGSEWHNTTTGKAYICTDATTDANVWTNVGAGTGNIPSFHGWGSNYGIASGGSGPSPLDNIQKYSFSSDGNATDVANMAYSTGERGGCSSSTHGYVMGGGGNNHIEKFNMVTDADGTYVGDLVMGNRNRIAGCMSSTYGYAMGGGEPTEVEYIEQISFASDGNSTDYGNLDVASSKGCGHNSSDYGYKSGGMDGGNSPMDEIQKFSFSSSGNATTVGDLAVAKRGIHSGQSSSTYGYKPGGGESGADRASIEKFSFASDGNSTAVGVLTVERSSTADSSSTTHGYSAGGYVVPHTNEIDKHSFSSDGNASDVGDLAVATHVSQGHHY